MSYKLGRTSDGKQFSDTL
ncbi:hypothetical protein [Clostridium sp. MCC353]